MGNARQFRYKCEIGDVDDVGIGGGLLFIVQWIMEKYEKWGNNFCNKGDPLNTGSSIKGKSFDYY